MHKIFGTVVRGDNYGKVLGFPTANLDRKYYARKQLSVKLGIYKGTAVLPSGKKYQAGIVIGPVDKRGLPKIEAHLLGFKGNLYNRKLCLILEKYLRPFKRFKTQTELQKQIQSDLLRIKKLR